MKEELNIAEPNQKIQCTVTDCMKEELNIAEPNQKIQCTVTDWYKHERRVKYRWAKPIKAQLQTDINMKEGLNIGCASAAWHTSVASVDDEDDSGWSLITTGDFFTGFHAGDGWYGTIVDWSIALQLKRLKELLVLWCVDLLGFCSIPFGVCSIDLVL